MKVKMLTICFNVSHCMNCLSGWRDCIDCKLVFGQNCSDMALKALAAIYLCFCRWTSTSRCIRELGLQTRVVYKVISPPSSIVAPEANVSAIVGEQVHGMLWDMGKIRWNIYSADVVWITHRNCASQWHALNPARKCSAIAKKLHAMVLQLWFVIKSHPFQVTGHLAPDDLWNYPQSKSICWSIPVIDCPTLSPMELFAKSPHILC